MIEADAKQIADAVLGEVKPILAEIAATLKALDHGVGNALHRIAALEDLEANDQRALAEVRDLVTENRDAVVEVRNEIAALSVALADHLKKNGEDFDQIGTRVHKLEEWRDDHVNHHDGTTLVETGGE